MPSYLRIAIPIGLLLLGGAGWYAWTRIQENPARRLERAWAALAANDVFEAETQAGLLERSRHPEHAAMVRGRANLQQASRLLREAAVLDREALPVIWVRQALLPADLPGAASAAGACASLHDPATLPQLAMPTAKLRERLSLQARASALLFHAAQECRGITAAELLPDGVRICGQAYQMLREQGRPIPLREAVGMLEAHLTKHPDDVDAHRWLAGWYLELGTVILAGEHLRLATELDPVDGRPARLRATLLRAGFRPALAIDAYRQALGRNLEPTARREVFEELAELLAQQGRLDEAEALAAQARQEDGAWAAGSALLLAAEADACRQRGRSEEAARLLDRALLIDGDCVSALRLRARLLLDAQRGEEALALVRRALAWDPHDHPTRSLLIEALELLGRGKEASETRLVDVQTHALKNRLTALGGEAAQKPWDDTLRVSLAEVCLQLERRGDARAWLKAALSCNPRNETARRLLDELDGKTPSP